MQVSHVRDHVTHAVIAPAKQRDFGIANSAEFFNILSSTLYSDQPLAVVREVVCNAWDAHIESGKTDTAIEITLNAEHLIIRDFGHGISDDDIGPIYGTYGASTKEANGAVTGGFGLGCKAPFAYSDHFEVISCHDGMKTIYNMSKSSAEVKGKPAIIPIASFPTTETGIQVKIPIKSHLDEVVFRTKLIEVIGNGDIQATLNGKPMNTLPFSRAVNGFMLVRDAQHLEQINIRYGNVIYPLLWHENFYQERDRVSDYLNQLSKYKLVLQAPPHSISVTPSRETLSMQEHTIETVKSLLGKFLHHVKNAPQIEDRKVAEEFTNRAWARMSPKTVLFSSNLPTSGDDRFDPKIIVDLYPAKLVRCRTDYNRNSKLHREDIIARLNSFKESGMFNTRLVDSLRSEVIRRSMTKTVDNTQWNWFGRKITGPLIQALDAAGFKGSQLEVFAEINHYQHGLKPAKRYSPKSIYNCLPFLRNIVVLSHTMSDIDERVEKFPVMRHWFGHAYGLLVYRINRQSKKVQELRDFFKAQGCLLLDLTVHHPWEPAKPKPEPKEKKPKVVGLPSLGSLYDGSCVRMSRLKENREITRLAAPDAVVSLSPIKDHKETERIPEGVFRAAAKLFGDRVAIASNSVQAKSYVDKGAKHFTDFIGEELMAKIKASPELQEAIDWDFTRQIKIDFFTLSIIYMDPELRKHFGIPVDLSGTDQIWFDLWRAAYASSYYFKTETFRKFCDEQTKRKAPAGLETLITKINTNQVLDLFDKGKMYKKILYKSADNQALLPTIRKTFLSAF